MTDMEEDMDLRAAAEHSLAMLDDLTTRMRRKDRDARLNAHAVAEAIDAHTDGLRSALAATSSAAPEGLTLIDGGWHCEDCHGHDIDGV